jgi:hypothetical protein
MGKFSPELIAALIVFGRRFVYNLNSLLDHLSKP